MVKFDVRGGSKHRKAYRKIKKAKTAKYECPACSKTSVRRESAGVWVCRSCGAKFAGGAYSLTTPAGRLAMRLISDLQKAGRVQERIQSIEQEVESVAEPAPVSEPAEGLEPQKEEGV